MDTPNVQGVCKDCGNGTLNNNLNRAFDVEFNGEEIVFVTCTNCGGAHVDVL